MQLGLKINNTILSFGKRRRTIRELKMPHANGEEELIWLNKDFFTKVLKQIENNEKIEIDNLKLMPATGKGDHYASVMYRATIDFKLNNEKKSTSMVLKAMFEKESHKKDAFGESFIFETEIGMYAQWVPKFLEILKANGENIRIAPKCVYHSLTPKKIIIFEDITPLGYEAERKQQLSLDDLKVTYEQLAKWHAVSHKILQEQPEFFDSFRHGLVNLKSFISSNYMKSGTKYFIEMLSEHEDLLPYKPYFEVLNEKNLLMSSVDSFNEYRDNPQASAFYVLCHGDFHYKNLMCKRDSKTQKLIDMLFLDYQMSYVGAPVLDLTYSFFFLLSPEQRLKNIDELLYWYFTKLKETLLKIGFKGTLPKMYDLKCQFVRHKNYELFLLTTILPFWLSLDEKYDDEEFGHSVEYHRTFFKNPQYLAQVRELLPKYLYLGYLEE